MPKENTLLVVLLMSIHTSQSLVGKMKVDTTAEVTIQDVVNSDDVNIYRELAGGVTTSNCYWISKPIGGDQQQNGNGEQLQTKCYTINQAL
jgi:hypothetical protein